MKKTKGLALFLIACTGWMLTAAPAGREVRPTEPAWRDAPDSSTTSSVSLVDLGDVRPQYADYNCSSLPVVTGMALDKQGDIYLGVYFANADGDASESYITKLGPDGSLKYIFHAGYCMSIFGIAVDDAGCAYITGQYGEDGYVSSGYVLPQPVGGPDLTFNGGWYDAFVAKVDASGSAFVYFGFIGGDASDSGCGIAVNTAGQAYVTGTTQSSSATFPAVGEPLASKTGSMAPFLAKVAADGSKLLYCSCLASSGVGRGLALDPSGNAWVCANFTSSLGFVCKIDPEGRQLFNSSEASSPIATTGVQAIAVDAAGCAYITGHCSGLRDAVVGPDLTYNGGQDAYVAKIKADGSGYDYCGFIGGDARDDALAIAVDKLGCAHVCGSTASHEDTLPVGGGPLLTIPSHYYLTSYIAKVKADGSGLEYCGYLGDNGYYDVEIIAVNHQGNACLAGSSIGAVIQSHQVRFSTGAGGSLTGQSSQVVLHGHDAAPVTAEPDTGHIFTCWNGSDGSRFTANPLTLTNVTGDLTVTADFPAFQLALRGARRESKAWMTRRVYAELHLTVDNPSGVGVARYALQRKVGNGDFVTIQETTATVSSGAVPVFYDPTLSRNATCNYRVVASDGSGKELAVSNQVTL
jgi:hypothetical protein